MAELGSRQDLVARVLTIENEDLRDELVRLVVAVGEQKHQPDDPFGKIEMPDIIPPAIAAAIVKAQRKVRALAKDKKGPGYSYAGMEDLIEEGRGILNDGEVGLALMPGSLMLARHAIGTADTDTDSGSAKQLKRTELYHFDMIRVWTLLHESGASLSIIITWPLYLQGGKRSRDKAVAAADTTSLGYLYRDLLGIPRLAEDQVDARDDEGTRESGVDPSESGAPREKKKKQAPAGCSSGKRGYGSRDAAKRANAKNSARVRIYRCDECHDWHATVDEKNKPAEAKAAEKKKKKTGKKKADPKAEKKAARAEEKKKAKAADKAATEPPPVDAEPEKGTGKGGTTQKGKTSVGQTYGEKADEVGQQQREAMTDEEVDAEIRQALSIGVTPNNTNDALVVELPPDPRADDLEGAGWPRELAEELEGYAEVDPVQRDALNVLSRKAAELLGLKFKQAKPMLFTCFEQVGVDAKGGKTPNGYQLRLWCMAVAGLAAAHEEANA